MTAAETAAPRSDRRAKGWAFGLPCSLLIPKGNHPRHPSHATSLRQIAAAASADEAVSGYAAQDEKGEGKSPRGPYGGSRWQGGGYRSLRHASGMPRKPVDETIAFGSTSTGRAPHKCARRWAATSSAFILPSSIKELRARLERRVHATILHVPDIPSRPGASRLLGLRGLQFYNCSNFRISRIVIKLNIVESFQIEHTAIASSFTSI
jgi:hypothetical protein